LHPTTDSDIRIEIWLPDAPEWNGKFQAVGNGGWSGAIPRAAMARALRDRYATAGTDTGHEGASAAFALGHPEKLIDFSERAVHLMTVRTKEIIKTYYGDGPRYSYWNGCSSGGRQGLREAQRFPEDYDGIIAGAPANNWTRLMTSLLWISSATLKNPESYLPEAKYGLVHQAVLSACDAADGLQDGLINDPRQCRFDPDVLRCQGDVTDSCLTATQVETVRKIYTPLLHPGSKEELYPPIEPGSELFWRPIAKGPQPFQIPVDHFRYVVYQNPQWDWMTVDFAKDVALADKIDDGLLNTTNPDLSRFFARGGKLLQYHGWHDSLIAPRNSINYYNSVVEKLGGVSEVHGSYRLFMEPGVGHCSSGEGPHPVSFVPALEQWVEHGRAPDQIIATHMTDGQVDRTRPLCPYPQVARYKGEGSIDEAANFTCVSPD
jgi:feruloyl esterase